MDKAQLNKNLCRQVEDIIFQANALESCQYFYTDFDNFCQYNQELKKFIQEHITNSKILSIAEDIPDISLKIYLRKHWYSFLLSGNGNNFRTESALRDDSKWDRAHLKEQYIKIYEELCGNEDNVSKN